MSDKLYRLNPKYFPENLRPVLLANEWDEKLIVEEKIPAVGPANDFLDEMRKSTLKYIKSTRELLDVSYWFNTYALNWKIEIRNVSSITSMTENQWYLKILDMGETALPCIFNELQIDPDRHWFLLLREITGESPIEEKDWGDFGKMVNAWLSWGRRNHYIS